MRNNPTPPVNCRYGAPMGRYTGPKYLDPETGKVSLRRVRLNSGGYDAGGAYWGQGAPLWYAEDGDGNSLFFRAATREAAKAALREQFGNLKFWR